MTYDQNHKPPKSKRMGLWRSGKLALLAYVVTSCSGAKSNVPVCSKTTALLRFDIERAPTTVANSKFFSNGGFIEVYTRKTEFSPVDSYRLCTAYVEFTDSPAESQDVLLNERLEMNVYTAAHCIDLAKDHSMKLHMFDHQGRTYYPVNVEYPLLSKVHELRKTMRDKKVSFENQKKVLNSLRTNAADLNSLFNQPTITSNSTGAGVSETAGKICLRRDDPVFNNVCSTYQDMIHFKIEPAASTPVPVIDRIKQMRVDSTATLTGLIAKSKLAEKFKANPETRLVFEDDKNTPLELIGIHKAVRNRVQTYSKFKMLQYVRDDLLADISACAANKNAWFCAIRDEFSTLIQVALRGTKYDSFQPSGLADIVEVMKSDYAASTQRMDTVFTVLEALVEEREDGSFFLPLDTRIHSNFRFVTLAEPTADNPDPLDTSRAFMHFNVNNLSGVDTGARNHFIKWDPKSLLGRFHHLEMHKEVTDEMRTQAATKTAAGRPEVPHMGFLQAGDSGSIITIENLPYFAVTSVNGESTSGGATIRPLPLPIEDDSAVESPSADAGKSAVKLCK
ncbi:MAG: hypothetical protein RLZZ488_1205 [Pseudomonadota bacterium]